MRFKYKKIFYLILIFAFACSNVDSVNVELKDNISPPIKFISPDKTEKTSDSKTDKVIANEVEKKSVSKEDKQTINQKAEELIPKETTPAKNASVVAPASNASVVAPASNASVVSPAKKATVVAPAKKSEKSPVSEGIISAADIIKEFEDNELAASVKYKDRNIRIKGLITNITSTIMGKPYVELGTGELFSFSSIRCMLSDASEAVSLQIGSTIEISATYESNIDTIIDMNPCTVVGNDSPGNLTISPVSEGIISAADIIKEFEDNELAASVKYKNQKIRIKGLITNITSTIMGKPYVELGTGELFSFSSIRCMISDASEAVGLQIDSTIEISGTYDRNIDTIIDMNPCTVDQ